MIGFILGPLILSFLLSLLRIYQKTILTPSALTPAPAVGKRKDPPPRRGMGLERSCRLRCVKPGGAGIESALLASPVNPAGPVPA